MSGFERKHAEHIRLVFQDAALRCSERCLYQSAKWYVKLSVSVASSRSKFHFVRAAELSTSLPSTGDFTSSPDTDSDLPMRDAEQPNSSILSVLSSNPEPSEAGLEAREASKYLLAKSYFDCREYDRCAAVFLPSNISREPLAPTSPTAATRTPSKVSEGKAKESGPTAAPLPSRNVLPQMSQKSLFLALYAKYMSGEKRKDEDCEMILGPADEGSTMNKELVGLGRTLEAWFVDHEAKGQDSQGWLEYLYGLVLIKGKSEEEGKKWLIRSVRRYSYNWGAWLELSELIGSIEEVCCLFRPIGIN